MGVNDGRRPTYGRQAGVWRFIACATLLRLPCRVTGLKNNVLPTPEILHLT